MTSALALVRSIRRGLNSVALVSVCPSVVFPVADRSNTPIFFIRDPILFPDFIHTQKRKSVTQHGAAAACKLFHRLWLAADSSISLVCLRVSLSIPQPADQPQGLHAHALRLHANDPQLQPAGFGAVAALEAS